MMGFSYEKRALKRTRLGPPDVYPQQKNQKEDELTTASVKHGFSSLPQLSDEFGSAHDYNVSASKIGAYLNAIVVKKEEINTLPDCRKRQQISAKEHFWPVTARNKTSVENWFKDLAACKPLNLLLKRVPNFNKKEEMFALFCEYQVPILRATWFIKLSSAYTIAVSEAKAKKRTLPDPTQEWTSTLLKYMKEQLNKIQDYYQNQSAAVISIGGATLLDEQKLSMKQWLYCTLLMKHMYQDGLLERQEVLQWILDLLDRLKLSINEDGLLRLLLSLTLQYLHEFVQSEQLSRKLVYLCARKISAMCSPTNNAELANITSLNVPLSSPSSMMISQSNLTSANNTNNSNSNSNNINNCNSGNNSNGGTTVTNSTALLNNNSAGNNTSGPTSDIALIITEYLKCPHHRDILISLSTIIQVVTLECPTALVWNNIGEGKSQSILNGSPLDQLLCAPSSLPMPQRCATNQIRSQLRLAEELIRQRSSAAQSRWSSDKWQQSSGGIRMQKILNTLDALDRHNFERIDINNSLDTLYNSIFTLFTDAKSNNLSTSSSCTANQSLHNCATKQEDVKNRTDTRNGSEQDETVVHILCEWAVSHLRTGEYRAIAVARLLEKRQNEILNPVKSENELADDDSLKSGPTPFPVFQQTLMKYLDLQAPIHDNSPGSSTRFTNLVHLFSQLIRSDMFSHDAYMCTLVSRGDLTAALSDSNNTQASGIKSEPVNPQSVSSTSSTQMRTNDQSHGMYEMKPNLNEHNRVLDYDDSKIDDDLDKLLQHIKQEQQNSMDGPDSPKVESGSFGTNSMDNHDTRETHNNENAFKSSSRHLLYATHFPLPLDDESSTHDCNQRYVLLYGVGKSRDDARHVIKRISKDICKLFSKKFSIDINEGGKVKKHSRNEFNFESITSRVQSLSYFDQHFVTYQCSTNLIEIINNFGTGNSGYLPVQEHVAFLFDLMELSLNIDGLIDLCIMILMEIPDVEAQLASRGSNLVKLYSSSLILYILGVLRRYHACLLLNQEQIVAVFEGLQRIVKNVNPAECGSAERCIFSHLHDLYATANSLLKNHSQDVFASNLYGKIKQAIYNSVLPSPSNHGPWNTTFMTEAILSYRRGAKIDPLWIRQLNESPVNRYSLVCNVIIVVCNERSDIDKLNDLGIFCSELTAACNSLTAEWLGVLMALCCSSNHPSYFGDVLSRVDVQDLTIHNSLAIFTAILVARNCFSLEDFVVRVALPSLLTVCNEGRRDACADAEAGARLTCHLLLRLFKTNESPQPALYSVGASPHPMLNSNTGVWCIKQSCDRHLLAATHNNIQVGPVLAVLKAIIVVGDATANRPGPIIKKSPSGHQTPNHSSKMSNELSISHILGTTDMLGGGSDHMLLDLNSGNCSETTAPNLSEFAQFVLREICSQEWVVERCLQNPEVLCDQDMLLDAMLSPKQAQRLLHMICYPEIAASTDNYLDHKSIINNIIQKLDQWTLRMSWLDMQLMYKQFAPNSMELNQWLDMVAKAAINVFQLNKGENKGKPESIWLVAPLISKLPSAVQGRVLKVAGQVLENINVGGSSSSGNSNSSNNNSNNNNNSNSNSNNNSTTSSSGGGGSSSRSSNKGTPQHQHAHMTQQQKSPGATPAPLIHHQPFLSLILTCLKEQDDQRETLLSSLHSQLSQFLGQNKQERICGNTEDLCGKGEDGLILRFSLVGGMFDTIQRNSTLTTDWAILLVQLITHGVVDNNNNSDLFSTVIDMLATLIHSTLVSDGNEKGEENRKHYQNLMKKLKKEVGDKKGLSVSQVRQLLPLPKQLCEVIACEQIGCLTDTKGNKITGFDTLDKKHGLQITEKQRVSPWDILEGLKNPAPLSWAWFGAIRMERKPLWYEDNHRLLKYHTHSLIKPSSYYLEPLPLPPEDIEEPMEKPCPCVCCNQMKGVPQGAPDTPTSIEQSPRGMKRIKQGPTTQRRKKQSTKPVTPTGGPMNQTIHPVQSGPVPPQHMPYNTGTGPAQVPPGNNGNMYSCPPGPPGNGPQWGNYAQQNPHMSQQGGPPYYSQQIPPGVPNGTPLSRFDRPVNNTNSKQALSQMLRIKGANQFLTMQQQGPMPHNFQGMPRQPFIRQQLRAQHPMQLPAQQGGIPNMFSNNGPNPNQQQMYSNMPQQGMSQNYPPNSYNNQQQTNPQQQQQQPQQAQMAPGNNTPPASNIMFPSSQPHQVPNPNNSSFGVRPEYSQQRVRSQYLQTPNVTMNGMNAQPPAAPPYSRPAAPSAQQMPVTSQQQQQFQQMNQNRFRQQLMVMQQQQQQSQQPTPALMAQLQRQMQNSGQQSQQQQQQNPYSMQPPPY